MTDPARGPTTEELRARALAQSDALDAIRRNADSWHSDDAAKGRALAVISSWAADPRAIPEAVLAVSANALLPRPCLACNREQGERMCDLCQRLEEAEAGA